MAIKWETLLSFFNQSYLFGNASQGMNSCFMERKECVEAFNYELVLVTEVRLGRIALNAQNHKSLV